jgi:hypothetical protein
MPVIRGVRALASILADPQEISSDTQMAAGYISCDQNQGEVLTRPKAQVENSQLHHAAKVNFILVKVLLKFRVQFNPPAIDGIYFVLFDFFGQLVSRGLAK